MTRVYKCHRCKQPCKPEGCATGYGIDKRGRKVCYECCALDDVATMERGEAITLYLVSKRDNPNSHEHFELTNWPATLRIIARVGERRHNMARKALSVWCTYAGREWYGMKSAGAYSGQCVTMRPLKRKPARPDKSAKFQAVYNA